MAYTWIENFLSAENGALNSPTRERIYISALEKRRYSSRFGREWWFSVPLLLTIILLFVFRAPLHTQYATYRLNQDNQELSQLEKSLQVDQNELETLNKDLSL